MQKERSLAETVLPETGYRCYLNSLVEGKIAINEKQNVTDNEILGRTCIQVL